MSARNLNNHKTRKMKKKTIPKNAAELIKGLVVFFLAKPFPPIATDAQPAPVEKQFMRLRQKREYTSFLKS